MSLSARIGLCVVALAFSLFGCTYTYQRKVILPSTGLPEQIYATPERNNYSNSSVGVFKFAEPPYAPGMGMAAAEALYEALLSNSVFARVTLELGVSDIRTESLIDIARARKYDLIITGDLLYYFEGSLHQSSRVDERIQVIHVPKNKTLWYSKAMEIGPSVPDTDYIVIEGRGARAPTARALLKRNAEKFCKMLLKLPPQKFSAPAVVPADEGAEANHLAVEKELLAALEEQRLQEERLREEARACREREEARARRERGEAEARRERGEAEAHRERGEAEARREREEMAQRKEFLNENIYFEFDKARLLPEAREILTRKAEWLKAHPNISVIVEGHCDERGTSEFNMDLGGQRARSTKSYLVELGIAPERLTTFSYGRERPLDPGHNEKAWARNRRVQFLME